MLDRRTVSFIRMAAPLTNVVVAICPDRDVEVSSHLARPTQGTLLSPVSSLPLQNLHQVTNDRIASVKSDRARRLVRASIVREPIDKLPSVLSSTFQVLPQLLVAAALTQLVHQQLRPGNKVRILRPVPVRRDDDPSTQRPDEGEQALPKMNADRLVVFRLGGYI